MIGPENLLVKNVAIARHIATAMIAVVSVLISPMRNNGG